MFIYRSKTVRLPFILAVKEWYKTVRVQFVFEKTIRLPSVFEITVHLAFVLAVKKWFKTILLPFVSEKTAR